MSHRAARLLAGVDAVLALDRRVASFLVRQPDFAEGVRAQLVDKDMKPQWNPEMFGSVDRDGLAAAIAGPERAPASA
jgi:enoyl-CoA hydratase